MKNRTRIRSNNPKNSKSGEKNIKQVNFQILQKGKIVKMSDKNKSGRKRALETSIVLNSSAQNSCRLSYGGLTKLNESLRKQTPSKPPKIVKTPGKKSPARLDLTPGISRKTPSKIDDRFIPQRVNFEMSRFLLQKGELGSENGQNSTMSPSQAQYQRKMAENLVGTTELESRIFSYNNKPPNPSDSNPLGLRVLYSNSKYSSPARASQQIRHIPQNPDRILDAPDIVNDYYLNLLDWSVNNHLAVALGPHIYLWNAASGEIQQLLELETPEDFVCSVKWIREGNLLAVGNFHGEVSLWDVEQIRKVRTMTGHTDRVGSLSWNEYILSSGSRSGKIHHHDVRISQHLVAKLSGHNQEVCGLAWSPDGKFLASGGNDNLLNIWSANRGERISSTTPMYSLTHHQAAVKALSWCPWQPNILASGGGTADRCIRVWNGSNGTLLNTIDTKSQVCSLVWASQYKELVSAHGYANNEVTIWKYPSMTKTAELLGHTERVLHLAISPDNTTVVSAGADETLRLWKSFKPDPNKTSPTKKLKNADNSVLRGFIR